MMKMASPEQRSFPTSSRVGDEYQIVGLMSLSEFNISNPVDKKQKG